MFSNKRISTMLKRKIATAAKKFPGLKLASIGPETSKTILALGLPPTFEAKQHTTDGLIAGLLKAAK